MFVANRLVFLELQKTGGSHIRQLLKQYTDGETQGKHNRLESLPAGKMVIGSIRNPWDWYVSLWAFGVGGKGAVRARSVTGVDWAYYRNTLPRAMGESRLTMTQLLNCVRHDIVKPTTDWAGAYRDADDAHQFRRWLQLLLAPARRYDIGEGFGFCPLSLHAGLLTYRYFRLFTLDNTVFHDKRLARFDGIADYDAEFNIAGAMIRTESLEADFIEALGRAGIELDQIQRQALLNKDDGKTNTSSRRQASYYYDAQSIDLVAQRDRYIIEKYGYQPPVV